MTAVETRGPVGVRTVLPNQSVVIVHENVATPSVTISVAARAGTMFEPADRSGLAHLLARVIDRGTTQRSADAIAEALDDRGVSLGVTSNRHGLILEATCLVDDFPQILELLVDVVRCPTFPEDQLARRRAEVVTALRQDEDNPAVRASDELFALLYGRDHPYGRRAKGTIEGLQRLDRAALATFHQARVAPDSVALVVAGAVRADEALAQACRLLEVWRGHVTSELAVPPPAPAEGRRRLVVPMMNKAQADIAYGFATVSRSDPAYYAFWLMNTVFGQFGLGGRLGEAIRERQGMAYYAYSTLDAAHIAGPLVVRAGVNPANVDRAVAAIDDEVRRLAAEGISSEELSDARQFLVGSIPRLLETNAGIASFLQTAEHFGLGLDYPQRLPGLLQAVSLEAVNAAARLLSPEGAAVVIAGPYGTAPDGIVP